MSVSPSQSLSEPSHISSAPGWVASSSSSQSSPPQRRSTKPSKSRSRGAPEQTPWSQVSSMVQGSPSSQAAVLNGCRQPALVSQMSWVHGSRSSQARSSGMITHPIAVSHTSEVQARPSSQSRSPPTTHIPSRHTSGPEHRSPSSQGALFGVWVQPLSGSQPSSVQGLPSPVQVRPMHASPMQALLSQPSGQMISVGGYSQEPSTHIPGRR